MKIKTLGPLALLCASFILAPVAAFAEGTITGVVINGFTGEPVRGATLTVEGTDISFKAGVGGDFRGAAPAGTYSVVVSRDGFEPQRVTDVVVTDGGNADFAVVLLPAGDAEPLPAAPEPAELLAEATQVADNAADETPGEVVTGPGADLGAEAVVADNAETGAPASESGVFIGSITVEAAAADSTASALLAERRNAPMISDSIGTEEMKKSTGSDAADAVKRVTGISVQNDKYVYVRGLGERYSNTSLNGSKIPSTEFEKKVVPFDLFPSGLLDTIRVSKSYTVDKPGDFAAGFVELETLDFPLQQTAGIGFSLGSHNLTSGESFGRYAGGLAWSGAGGQPLPGGIPDDKLVRLSPITGVGFTSAELQEYGLSFVGQWRGTAGPVSMPWGGGAYSAPFDGGYNLSYGNTFGRLGMVLSGTHSTEFRSRQDESNFYRVSMINDSGVELENSFDFDTDSERVKRGMVANFAYRLSDNHNIKLRTMFNTLSASQATFQEGFFSDLSADIRNYRVNYKDQQINSYQLSGEHYLPIGAMGSLLEWRGSSSTAETSQDYRYALYGDFDFDGEFVLTDNASSGFMFFNDLNDTVDDLAADWTTFFSSGSSFGSVKGGVAYTTTDRDFFGRRLRFKHRSTRGIDLTLPPEELFVEANIRPDGFELEETTRPTDNYTATQDIPAAYVQGDWNFGKLRLIGGLRYEDSSIEVVTRDIFSPDAQPLVTILDEQEWLPALSLVYRVGQAHNLRVSASQTVNRPEFRELAPFNFTDAVGGWDTKGNPELVSATIRSYDARWEWFPSSTDVVAVSLFHKDFTNPIEAVVIEAITNIQSWENSQSATNSGLELELRRTFNADGRHLFTTIVNYSRIESEITIQEGSPLTNATRPLVGQPDNVGNLVLEWQQPSWRSSARVLYNYVGERVAYAGASGLPDVLEDPRGSLDLSLVKGFDLFGIACTAKVSGENLTDEPVQFSQGGQPFLYWQPGTVWKLSVGLTLF